MDNTAHLVHALERPQCCAHCTGQIHSQNFGEYEPTWTTKQVAEFLGLKAKTIFNLVHAGELKPRKQDRLNAFIPSEVSA
ncbi:hypothetical protein B4915_01640 [Leucobacter massiliensis]|uniref:Helix-turn-helix domain-containing protein n=2 Tax=Leucobacter massiliensis TaxID=1686285 RepID=A0A2S9QS41_9MICO|nr:hypothetical protein B4915_01640 [Leucobacter massiliensis]